MNPRDEKYLKIFESKRQDPSIPLAHLCKQHGVGYQSYYLWLKRYRALTSNAVGNKVKVTLLVSPRDLVNALTNGIKEIPMALSDVVRRLTPEDTAKLAGELGRFQLEQLTNSKTPQDLIHKADTQVQN